MTGALIAGNAPQDRLPAVQRYWELAELDASPALPWLAMPRLNGLHLLQVLALGRPGLFQPRLPSLWSLLPGMPDNFAYHGPGADASRGEPPGQTPRF